ncbi:ras and Rab interactor 2 [Aplochiton taeniatus]
MSASKRVQASPKERKGSFFKLIDSFACEIGTLKKEMVQKAGPAKEDTEIHTLQGLDGEVGGLFLQAPPCGGVGAGVRDSGYDSLHRRMSVLDRLAQTHAVWLQLGLSHADATRILQEQPTGTFLVRKSLTLQRKVISLRMDKESETVIKDFPVKESQYTFSLEGSGLSFADLFRLVSFCCISRDVLPFILRLPDAICAAKTPGDLEELAKKGAGFWDSALSDRGNTSVSRWSGTTLPTSPASPGTCTTPTEPSSGRPRLHTRTPSELECCQSNGALCFINPLFAKVHSQEGESRPPRLTLTCTAPNEDLGQAGTPVDDLDKGPENDGGTLDQSLEGPAEVEPQIECTEGLGNNSPSQAISRSRSPPPRPPPPRFSPPRPAPPRRQASMPAKISWINPPKEKGGEKGTGKEKASSLLYRLGSSLTISPSSSPPNKLSISSPISIPRPTLPLSLSSLSPSSRRPKPTPSPSQVDAHCHLALEDQTIERALSQAKLARRNATAEEEDSHTPPSCSLPVPPLQREKAEEGRVRGDSGGGGGQRLSDMSLSTDSSDSFDFSHSSSFFMPALHDPSPPTAADYAQHLPLSLPPALVAGHPYSSMEEDEDEEEEDEEVEPDYGVSLESDQEHDHDLTLTPPGRRTKRRASAGALVIQRALRCHLRKVSGVFNSLLTPERRAIRKVLELSQDKGSYFGCLVQDYLSYLQEGGGAQAWQCHSTGLELLQTLRHFITQMKCYLRQSSELEPPIETLIPEEQIDQVLEKAMHKIVLKPLKAVVALALQEFQVRSGAWQELKENMSLAKARQPQEMGVADTPPPDPVAVEKIRHKFHTMCKLYSPDKKVTMLLRVCKLIYTIMEDNSGRLYGADDFLPMLTYVLAQCDMPQLDNEILYMMELLDPSLLHGEGGYYLTSAYGAMSLIRNFQEEQAARALSSETRDTLHQWHRRRTTQRTTPSVDDFQNYLRVALQEIDSGCTAKTLQVRPYATAEEICEQCAFKFKVEDPENYALFLLTEGTSQQLSPDTHPQKIKAELHSRTQATPFHFVFRRVANLNDQADPRDPLSNFHDVSPAPANPDPNHNELAPSSRPEPQANLNQGLSPSLSLSLPPDQHNGNSLSI